SQAVPLHCSRDEGFDEDIEAGQHPQQQSFTFRRLEIQSDVSLPTRIHVPPERSSCCRPLAQRITDPWFLNFHNIGAKIRKEHARQSARKHSRQVQDTKTLKWFHIAANSIRQGLSKPGPFPGPFLQTLSETC